MGGASGARGKEGGKEAGLGTRRAARSRAAPHTLAHPACPAPPRPPQDGSFKHPYSYHLFLGADGEGNLLPCRQLRDKYCTQRRDVYSAGESEWEDGGSDGGSGGGDGGGNGSWPFPGIDMRSMD